MLAKAPLILVAVAIFGLYETTLLTLLPVWGVRLGLSDRFAATTVSAVYIGAILMQFPIGWLSDKMERLVVLRLCGVVGLVGAILVIAIAAPTPVLFLLLFVWGGIASGIYPVALGMAGDSFRGGDLITANAAIIMAYGVGSLVGPTLGGVAMDFWNPQGLLALFVLLFGCFLLMTLLLWRPSVRNPERLRP
jgi:MFS family permease